MTENFLKNNNLYDSENLDALLELASLVRTLIDTKNYSDINKIINYTIKNNYCEAFSWTMEILQEELEKKECAVEDFYCHLGSQIANYDQLVCNLQVNFNSIDNYIEKIYDKNGEVEEFFNIMVYNTRFENIFFISSENFDTKDNDYIQYKLSFVK